MKPFSDEIVLRPRFRLSLPHPKEQVLGVFNDRCDPPFLVHRVDDHVFIKFRKEETHFWSPQLHLEINEKDKNSCLLYGLFGPNPTLWTFFMFIHFIVGSLFIILGIWAYSNASLGKAWGLQAGLMVLMIVIWGGLYVLGRSGKSRGRPQMRILHQYMHIILQEAASADHSRTV